MYLSFTHGTCDVLLTSVLCFARHKVLLLQFHPLVGLNK
jgi:hypothetical protein